ncbi:MAG: HAD family phosphatase, partial [Pyramidobacter sp.]|nr:HAD family phosphatase [Pyramidobacter sp.]
MRTPLLYPGNFKGVVFDWDGVIAETKLNFQPIRDRFFGGQRVPLLESARTLPPSECDAVMKAIAAEERRGAAASTPVPGALELIRLLNERRVPWCVMSRNCRESIDLAARTIGFPLPLLTFGREAVHVKPDPRAFEDAASGLGVNVRDCLVIGDFLYELIGARRAGARCVLVNRADAECESYADATFATMRDLFAAFAANRPFVPWEYHDAAARFGTEGLEAMYNRTAFFDSELNAVSLARLENLASLGLGMLRAARGREVTARELAATPALAP